MNQRCSTAGPIAAILLGIALLIYGGSYFALAENTNIAGTTIRLYERAWQASFYRPAAKVESLLTHHDVVSAHDPPWICDGR